jgi:hypothetical protein
VKVTWATPAELEKRAAAADAAAKSGKVGEPNMFNQAAWEANDVEALPDGAAKSAGSSSAPQTIVLSKTLDDVRALVSRISAGQGPTQAEVTKAVEVATPAVSELAASAQPAIEAAAGKVTAYLQKKAPEVASLMAAPAKPGAAPAPIDVGAVGAEFKSFAQKVAPGAVAAVGAANPQAGAQLAALAKSAGVDVSKGADPLKVDDIAKAVDAVGAKINATVQDPHFVDKVRDWIFFSFCFEMDGWRHTPTLFSTTLTQHPSINPPTTPLNHSNRSRACWARSTPRWRPSGTRCWPTACLNPRAL